MELRVNNINFENPSYQKRNLDRLNIAFTGNSIVEFIPSEKLEQYKRAEKYVQKVTKNGKVLNIDKCDPRQLEGIQYGIPVFDGLNFKQVKLIYKYLTLISTYRGCSNGCVHCFIDAKPIHVKKGDSSTIKSMAWEDFERITDGYAQLSKRLGFGHARDTKVSPVILPFIDADCMEIVMKDKNGNEHDMIDIAKKIQNELKKGVVFDTVGWNPKNKRLQKRAEKYVAFLMQHNHNANDPVHIDVNISLNPFHKLHEMYIKYKDSDPAKALKFRNLYTDQMANTFYTFTPLLKNERFRILNRAVAEDLNCDENYKIEAHKKLISEIREKLKTKYIESGMPAEEIENNLKLFDKKTEVINSQILQASGRLKNLFDPDGKEVQKPMRIHERNFNHPESILDNPLTKFLVDCNGKVYLTDMIDTIPTDICLNLINKDKETIPYSNMLNKVIPSEIIKEIKPLKMPFHKKVTSTIVKFLKIFF